MKDSFSIPQLAIDCHPLHPPLSCRIGWAERGDCMEFVLALGAVFLFSLACNLDTVLLAVGYAVKGVRVTAGQSVLVAAVTTGVTLFSLVLGDAAAAILAAGTAEMLGGLALIGIGFWFLLDWLRGRGGGGAADAPAGLWGWVSLAAALAVNNAGSGVAAGVSGIHPLWAAACNFFMTLAALPLGRWLGCRVAGRLLGAYALPLSGALLVVLGVLEALL